jgi:hypothetical protein
MLELHLFWNGGSKILPAPEHFFFFFFFNFFMAAGLTA